MEAWFTERAFDGFVVVPTYPPGTFEEFERRGVYRKECAGTTLRDHLGLARPEVGAWRH